MGQKHKSSPRTETRPQASELASRDKAKAGLTQRINRINARLRKGWDAQIKLKDTGTRAKARPRYVAKPSEIEKWIHPHVHCMLKQIRGLRNVTALGPTAEYDLRITVTAGERIPLKYLRAGILGIHRRLRKAGFHPVETELYPISPVAPSAHDGKTAQPATGV
ncbi:hypothetical protein [Geminisphaera colitermitum]|uniref:hypothetical protein n=1 Tax=Geminisphaera colitermitum TaxID=1148786 RepID=UPI0001964E08|nr:hypothetical protein [Geminisphaera colitermitum]